VHVHAQWGGRGPPGAPSPLRAAHGVIPRNEPETRSAGSNLIVPTTPGAWAAFYREGGELMHVILALGVVGLAIIVERSWRLYVGQRVDVRRLMRAVQSRMLAGDTAGALRMCSPGRSMVARVVRVGLMAGVDPQRSEVAIREARLGIEPGLRKRLPTLGALANLAMLIGLLGTIQGLTDGFHHCSLASTTTRAAAISHGIAIAVHTTGFGILVGIVLLSARLVLVSSCEKLAADVALAGAKIVGLIRVCSAHPRGVRRLSTP
jgi:biopolymer transport protein ExbB